jgi:hypothetical protein
MNKRGGGESMNGDKEKWECNRVSQLLGNKMIVEKDFERERQTEVIFH